MQLTLMQLLRDSVAEGRTVLFSSHSLSEIESLCNHVLMIRQGIMVVDESLRSLQAKAPRIVRLTTQTGSEIDWSELPESVMSIQRVDSQVELLVKGASKEVVHWAARQSIADISISPPSLDRLFREYYLEDDRLPTILQSP
jgi:ABC-2 type transport system ATP-binding protein